MHDAKGRELKVGDVVLVPMRVAQLTPSDDYCNARLESVYGRRRDGSKEVLSALNTGVTLKCDSQDGLYLWEKFPAAETPST